MEGLKARLSYTYMDTEFEDYQKNEINPAGNEIPGLPNHEFFGEILYRNHREYNKIQCTEQEKQGS